MMFFRAPCAQMLRGSGSGTKALVIDGDRANNYPSLSPSTPLSIQCSRLVNWCSRSVLRLLRGPARVVGIASQPTQGLTCDGIIKSAKEI